ncbi:NAD(P)/FAD-dependent oxidoreductase [Pantoea sp. 1.19]|uniref:NAD(P)/FAD-dependent oxidoreductase n=1 Tax=Pantoea sp. 1.19 TaxID=1925589 RepID=UPI000948D2B7|nr:FAD-dependent oxidoreductase [Pantoea sp. 1.19]
MQAGIVIIGGGQAGGWATKTLRDRGYAGRISVIAEEPHDFYERPPLSKSVLTSPDVALSRLFSEATQQTLNVCWYRPQRAESILPATKQVRLSSGEVLTYDKLLIATGSRPRWPSAEWQAHPRVHTLRSWQDALTLRDAFSGCRRLAIVGGGWIGLEIAASARSKGIAVSVFERQQALCQRSVSAGVSAVLAQLHRDRGVDIQLGCGEIVLGKAQDRVDIRCNNGSVQTFDHLIVGIGVDLNTALAREAGLTVRQGIVVNGKGQTSDPDIYAAGDVALHPQTGLSLQSWAFAQNQAIATACAMLDDQAADYQDLPWLWSDQYQHHIQILGTPPAGGLQVSRCEGDKQLWFTLDDRQRLAQLVAFNDPRTIKLAKRWMQSGRPLDAAQLADPDFSLMTLR